MQTTTVLLCFFFLDLSKAFDSVDYGILCQRLLDIELNNQLSLVVGGSVCRLVIGHLHRGPTGVNLRSYTFYYLNDKLGHAAVRFMIQLSTHLSFKNSSLVFRHLPSSFD